MTRDQRIAAVLGGTAGVLAIALIVLKLGIGTGYSVLDLEAGEAPAEEISGLYAEPPKLGPSEEYADILARPMFNESRKPEVNTVVETPTPGAVGELDAALTGTIVTDKVKIAFIRDNKTNEVQRVKLGQPLEGEQSGWTLMTVNPRSVVFEGSGTEKELELSVDEKGAPPPVPVALPQGPASVPPVEQAQPDPSGQPPQPVAQGQPANADEIRKRIEERRRQLREEAQRMMQEQQQNKQ